MAGGRVGILATGREESIQNGWLAATYTT